MAVIELVDEPVALADDRQARYCPTLRRLSEDAGGLILEQLGEHRVCRSLSFPKRSLHHA